MIAGITGSDEQPNSLQSEIAERLDDVTAPSDPELAAAHQKQGGGREVSLLPVLALDFVLFPGGREKHQSRRKVQLYGRQQSQTKLASKKLKVIC